MQFLGDQRSYLPAYRCRFTSSSVLRLPNPTLQIVAIDGCPASLRCFTGIGIRPEKYRISNMYCIYVYAQSSSKSVDPWCCLLKNIGKRSDLKTEDFFNFCCQD